MLASKEFNNGNIESRKRRKLKFKSLIIWSYLPHELDLDQMVDLKDLKSIIFTRNAIEALPL